MSEDLINQKRTALKEARKQSKKSAINGQHGWGDFYRNQHIKQLERELQALREQQALAAVKGGDKNEKKYTQT
jgi:hypothetical protein